MPNLNDTSFILLVAAAQRDSGSLLPFPDTLTPGARLTKALLALVRAGYAEERETSAPDTVHRTDGDLRFGLFVTPAGLQAIGVEQEDAGQDGNSSEVPVLALPAVSAATAPRTSKSAAVLALLSRPEGATMPELIEATGWLPHTTRAALTGLRKKGHAITRSKRGDATCYSVSAAVEA